LQLPQSKILTLLILKKYHKKPLFLIRRLFFWKYYWLDAGTAGSTARNRSVVKYIIDSGGDLPLPFIYQGHCLGCFGFTFRVITP
jgi:hypothetical protein